MHVHIYIYICIRHQFVAGVGEEYQSLKLGPEATSVWGLKLSVYIEHQFLGRFRRRISEP